MPENEERRDNRGWLEQIARILYTPLLVKKNRERLGELPQEEKNMAIDQNFLDNFLKDTKEGKRWCEEAAMHWAEILTFSFSKMIITFDLGVLAFIGAMRESFFNQTILALSIMYALASLLTLVAFVRSVIVKNINSLAERVRILNYTMVLAPDKIQDRDDAKSIAELWKRQGVSLKKNLGGSEDHTKSGIPWQKIGVLFFYASILSALVGIIL